MIFNISMLNDFCKCPQFWHNAHIERRVSAQTPTALEVGAIFHKAMAALFRGARWQESVLHDELLLRPESMRQWDMLKWYVEHFEIPRDWEILEVEQPLRAPLGKHILEGTPDFVVRWNGGLWSGQDKTYSTELDLLLETVRNSPHEIAYQYLIEQHMATSVRGTILCGFKKLPEHKREGGKLIARTDSERMAGMASYPVTRTAREMGTGLRNISRIADLMEASLEHGADQVRFAKSCMGSFGNSRCQYYGVCFGEDRLEAPIFRDAPDRYVGIA